MAKRSRDDEDSPGDESQEEALSAGPSKPAKSTKKAKKETSAKKKGSAGKNVSTNSNGESFVDLGKKRRVTIRKFNAQTLIDIREFYGEDDDDLKPGKKGISLSVEQWEELKANVAVVDGLIKKLAK